MVQTDCIYLNDPAIFQTIVTAVTLTSNLQNTLLVGKWLVEVVWSFPDSPYTLSMQLGNVEDQV